MKKILLILFLFFDLSLYSNEGNSNEQLPSKSHNSTVFKLLKNNKGKILISLLSLLGMGIGVRWWYCKKGKAIRLDSNNHVIEDSIEKEYNTIFEFTHDGNLQRGKQARESYACSFVSEFIDVSTFTCDAIELFNFKVHKFLDQEDIIRTKNGLLVDARDGDIYLNLFYKYNTRQKDYLFSRDNYVKSTFSPQDIDAMKIQLKEDLYKIKLDNHINIDLPPNLFEKLLSVRLNTHHLIKNREL